MEKQNTIAYKYYHGIPCVCYYCRRPILSNNYARINGKYICNTCKSDTNKIFYIFKA